MCTLNRVLCSAAIAACLSLATAREAAAQYPDYYQAAHYGAVYPVAPAVVGYTARRAGLFGQRVVVRSVVAPVVATSPIYAAPVHAVARPVVVAARPVYAPVGAVVQGYYTPPVRVAVPVTTYRIPVGAYAPMYGY